MFLSFNNIGMPRYYLSGFSTRFQALSRSLQVGCLCITHPFATKSSSKLALFVRLACIRHAASVHPEPGSNSHVKKFFPASFIWHCLLLIRVASRSFSSICLFLNLAIHFSENLGIFRVALLFICQRSVILRCCCSQRQLWYLIMTAFVCQQLF